MWGWCSGKCESEKGELKVNTHEEISLSVAPSLAPTTPVAGTCAQEQVWKILRWIIWPAHGKSFQVMVTGDPSTGQISRSQIMWQWDLLTGEPGPPARVHPISSSEPPIYVACEVPQISWQRRSLIHKTGPQQTVRKKDLKTNNQTKGCVPNK